VIPGWHWLQDPPLLDAIESALESGAGCVVVNNPRA